MSADSTLQQRDIDFGGFKGTNLGAPTVATDAARLQDVQGISSVVTWGNDSVAASADTRVLAPGYDRTIAATDGGNPGGGSEGAWRAPRSGTMRNMRVRHNSSSGNGNSVTYTLRKNGVATALTATLASGALGDASDLVNTVAIAAGDLIELTAAKPLSLGSGGVSCMVSVEFV